MAVMRLQRFLSLSGVASRRKAEEFILRGNVSVNDVVVRELGTKIDSDVDRVLFRGKPLTPKNKHLYYVLNKPPGVMVTKKDPEGRRTVYQLIHHLDTSVNSVGRLDQDSEGLLLMTNDGDLAYRLTHPSFEVNKVYHVQLKRLPTSGEIQKLKNGIQLEEGLTSPAQVQVIQKTPEIWLEVQIHEGKKRQVRRMMEAVDCPVLRLLRVKIGPLELGDLPTGRWRLLSSKEVISLRRGIGLKD